MVVINACKLSIFCACILSCCLDQLIPVVGDISLYNPESSGIWSLIRVKSNDSSVILPFSNVLALKGKEKLLFVKEYRKDGNRYSLVSFDDFDVYNTSLITDSVFNSFSDFDYHFKMNDKGKMIRVK